MQLGDTIAAVSSPPGRGWRGMIRVAGGEALSVAAALLAKGALSDRRVARCVLRESAIPVLATLFRGPGSYCGDDTVELQLPGHPALLERVLHACFAAGARSAEPGEFTYRAWRAGKLDLLEAEGVAAMIAARSDAQLDAARQLHGRALGRTADTLAATLTDSLALVEAGIDFTDQEDVVPIAPRDLHERLRVLLAQVRDLLQRSRSWSALDALPRVVLAGPPSTGKSTLFNALLGRERAVTDPLPGTTRDVIEEAWTVAPGREVMLADLAGLDDAGSALDAEAQRLAQEAIGNADVVLWLGSPEQPGPGATSDRGPRVITVRSRADLDPAPASKAQASDAYVSGTTGEGLDHLRRLVLDRLGTLDTTAAGDALTLQPRHADALRNTGSALHAAADRVHPDAHALADPEWVAMHLRDALDALGTLSGRIDPDTVIGRVFAVFCVGK